MPAALRGRIPGPGHSRGRHGRWPFDSPDKRSEPKCAAGKTVSLGISKSCLLLPRTGSYTCTTQCSRFLFPEQTAADPQDQAPMTIASVPRLIEMIAESGVLSREQLQELHQRKDQFTEPAALM